MFEHPPASIDPITKLTETNSLNDETGREAGESWLTDMDEVAETIWRNELTDTVHI